MAQTPEEIRAAAARVAETWKSDWEIYLTELARLTGLTIEQALLWDMALTFRDMNVNQGKNIEFVKKHIRDEHGPDEPWKTPE